MHAEVLIVGAGPTGLMLANQLARRGVRVLIVDRESGPAQQTRAMAVQARTLEIYAKLDLAQRAVALGRRGNGANLWANGRRSAHIPLGEIGQGLSPFPYVLMLGQDDNERILGARLRDFGVEVRWNTELVALRQEQDCVEVALRAADGSERGLSARYVAGCDGGHSRVRELCGIGFPGAPYEHVFFVADTTATGPMVPEELNAFLWRDGFHLFFPMPGADRWRVIGIVPRELPDIPLAFEQLEPAIRRSVGVDVRFQSCSWFSTYRIHHRCAERFRAGRCFIAGDAAHVHSPAGGQGMNTGLQDAYNLAWKLALAVRGEAAPTLLDSYEQERRKVAQRLLRSTDRAFGLIVSEGLLPALVRTRIAARIGALAMRLGRVRRLAFRTVSQIGIRYRDSALSQDLTTPAKEGPHAGDRFPWLVLQFHPNAPAEDLFRRLDDTRFNLIVIGQPSATSDAWHPAVFAVQVVADTPFNRAALAGAGIPKEAFYLLRPDGHIGLAGARLVPAEINRYLNAVGIRSAAAENALLSPTGTA